MSWLTELVTALSEQLDERVREAYWSRGVDDSQISLFRLGYINGNLPGGITYPQEFLKWSADGAKLVDSYVFPLTNALGEIRGVQFRAVDRGTRGYMDYFDDDGVEPVLFGLGEAAQAMWGSARIVLVEGVFDLFPIQRVTPEVVATLTAKVSAQFARLLRRFARQVYLSYDLDAAGKYGTERFLRVYGGDYTHAQGIEYPQVTTMDGKVAKDPSEIWEAWGDDRLAEHLRCTIPTLESESESNNATEFL